MQMSEIQALLDFLLRIVYYFVPCVIGSFLGSIIKCVRTPSAHIKITRVLLFATVPSILIAALNDWIRSFEFVNSNFIIGLSIVSGIVGEDLTRTFSTIRGILQIAFNIKTITSAISASSKLDLSDPESEESTKKEEEKEPSKKDSKKKK
jgi:hypothetical protein